MKIISWYTNNTPYEEVIKECLIPSLKKLNIEPIIYAEEFAEKLKKYGE